MERKLASATVAVMSGLSLRVASERFNVPKETLRRQVIGVRTAGAKAGRPTVLPQGVEAAVASFLLSCARFNIPISPTQLKVIAKHFARSLLEKEVAEQFKAGKQWRASFLKRHDYIEFVKPKPVDVLRFHVRHALIITCIVDKYTSAKRPAAKNAVAW